MNLLLFLRFSLSTVGSSFNAVQDERIGAAQDERVDWDRRVQPPPFILNSVEGWVAGGRTRLCFLGFSLSTVGSSFNAVQDERIGAAG